MLVLSRRLGEGVVLNHEAVAILAVIGRDFVELSLTRLDGSFLGTITIALKEKSLILAGIWGVVIRIEGDKVRLGFDGPPDSRIDRQESWAPPGRC